MKILYQGLFFDEATKAFLLQKVPGPRCDEIVRFPHVTFDFFRKGQTNNLFPDHVVGTTHDILVTHYGNDGMNEGVSVDLLTTGQLKQRDRRLYQGADVPHITLSAAMGAAMKNTKDLDFKPIESFIITGRLGFYTPSGVLYHSPALSTVV